MSLDKLVPHLALDTLQHLFHHLPPSIPEEPAFGSRFAGMHDYYPDPDAVDLYGSEQGALNHDLEILFGRRDQGPVQLLERGAGLEAVVGFLKKYINGKSKEQDLLIKNGQSGR